MSPLPMTKNQTLGLLFDQYDADLLAKYKAITPDQFAAEEQRRKLKAEYEALHTPIETDADRANTDEYPEDDQE